VSELPNGWVQIALGEALQIQKGKKPIGLGPKGEDRSVPYINISAFETKQVEEYAPEQDVPRCQPSDTLLVWDGARAGLAGRGVGGFIGSTLARLTSDLADSSYLYYFVHSNYGYLNTHTKGVGIPHIDPIVLAKISFPLPPASEQTRIVAKLEELLTDLDAGVAELKTAQKKLGQYRQSLLKAAVEGALTAEWRAKNTPSETGAQLLQRILTERRARWEAKQLAKFQEQGKTSPKDWKKKYPEPAQPDTTGLPELPQGWVWASVDQVVADSLIGLDRGQDQQSASAAFGYIKMNNISMTGSANVENLVRVDANLQEVEKYSVVRGDVLFNTRNSVELVGKVGLVHSLNGATLYNNNLMRLRFDGVVLPEFLCWQMCGPEFRSRMERVKKATTSVAAVYAKDLFPLALAVPPLDEQAEILRVLSSGMAGIETQELAITHSLKQSAAQRQNILRAAFAGQLVPQNPNDEPASALLERIRTERTAQASVKKPRGRPLKGTA